MMAAKEENTIIITTRILGEMMAVRSITKAISHTAKGSDASTIIVVPKVGHRLRKSFLTTSQNRFQSNLLFITFIILITHFFHLVPAEKSHEDGHQNLYGEHDPENGFAFQFIE